VNLAVGAVTEAISKWRYERTRTMNVLLPGTLTNQGATATYYYNEAGSDPIDGMEWSLDTSVEATWRIAGTNQAGFKAEVFNVTNRQEKIRSNNTVWCNTDEGAGCATARENFGKATQRGSFARSAVVPLLDDLPVLGLASTFDFAQVVGWPALRAGRGPGRHRTSRPFFVTPPSRA
jgi:hypothetical protein